MDRSNESVPDNAYFTQISQYVQLSADEEIELAKQIEAGHDAVKQLETGDHTGELERCINAGAEARRKMIEHNLRLVVYVARRSHGRGLALLDMVQEGNIGLQVAVDKFDWRRGLRFSTMASWWIRQAITRAVHQQGRAIRLPEPVMQAVTEVGRTAGALYQELGREPKVADIAQRLKVSPQRVMDLMSHQQEPVSLDEPLGDDEPRHTVADRLGRLTTAAPSAPPDDDEARFALGERMEVAMTWLSPRERRVLSMRYGLADYGTDTQDGVASVLGVSRCRIQQIEHGALAKLRRQTGLRTKVSTLHHRA